MKLLPRRDTRILMFTAALFVIAETETTCLPTDEWIKEMRYIPHTVEPHADIKWEILPFVMTVTILEGIMLSKMSQKEKEKYCTNSLTYGLMSHPVDLAHLSVNS